MVVFTAKHALIYKEESENLYINKEESENIPPKQRINIEEENELKIALWWERSIESDTIIRDLKSKKDTQLAALKMEIDKLKMENEQSLYLALMNYFRSFNQFIIKFTIEIYSLQDGFCVTTG